MNRETFSCRPPQRHGLAAALNAGLVHGRSREGQDVLDALYDGLHVLAENLNALTLPYPPPVVPAPRGRHLRVVK